MSALKMTKVDRIQKLLLYIYGLYLTKSVTVVLIKW